jgi:uncharacterized surface protein with fasciclin (FAS1) repeats
MKRFSLYKWPILVLLALVAVVYSSCNKNVPDPTPIEYPVGSGNSIAELLNDPNYSLLKTAVTRVGLLDALNNKSSVYTLFAPNNAAFGRVGITTDAQINGLPLSTLTPLIQYHLVPGQELVSSAIPDSFPNAQLPTAFVLPAPNTNPLVRMSTFPSRRGSNAFVNNIPVTRADIQAANGVMHDVFVPLFPPSRVLADTLSRDTSFSYLMRSIQKADSLLPAGSKFVELLSNPVLNFTVFAPNNNAFRALLGALGLPPNDITSINRLPSSTVLAIVAYHIHIKNNTPPTVGSVQPFTGSRAFSVNLPVTPTAVNTWLKVILNPNPAPPIVVTVGPPATVKGFANATASNIIAVDRNCVNGVFHVIDQVMRPQ